MRWAIDTSSDEDSEDDDENERAGEISNEQAGATCEAIMKKMVGDEYKKDETTGSSGTERVGHQEPTVRASRKRGKLSDALQDSGKGSPRWVA